MSTTFIAQDIWPQLTKAVRDARQPCAVAVAYFGAGAGRLLPLPEGSYLVVDASERAVASGQTCPDDLIKLVKRGVKVFSVANLHAKVFVLGGAAYIGSANVSNRSASQLIEAVIRTTEPGAVRAAQKFVREHCLHELTPDFLTNLAKLYRPPLVPGGKRGEKEPKDSFRKPTLPKLHLAQLVSKDWSEKEQALYEAALSEAKKKRKYSSGYELDDFQWSGECPFKRGDLIIQVTDEGGGSILVAPPGKVLHVGTRSEGKRKLSVVFLERPVRRRRQVKVLAKALGNRALKRLRRNGVVQNAFAQALLNTWVD